MKIKLRFILKLIYHRLFSKDDFTYTSPSSCIIDIKKRKLKSEFIQKNIWLYWADNNPPEYIKSIIKNISEKNLDYQLHLLSDENLNHYLGDLTFNYTDLPLANKSDIIRLELLYKFGGVWIDATTIFYSGFNWIDQLIDSHGETEYDCIGYYRALSTTDYHYPVIESWFLCAPKGNAFIKRWLDELSPIKEIGHIEYFKQIECREDYEAIRQKITTPNYLLVYLACQLAMRSGDFNVYLKKCEADAFFYQTQFDWLPKKMTILLTQVDKPKKVPDIIKLTRFDRADIDKLLRLRLIKKSSIIGEFTSKK